ncbi:MAG TPA: dipeptidase [Terriglobales bacterium]|jgi:acetylornithine deacetylase/succinyl-diaminopimelate desuccinylase-like protein
MSTLPKALTSYLDKNADRSLAELKDFLRIPSISTLPAHKPDMARALDFLAKRLTAIGLEHVKAVAPKGLDHANPILYADWLHAPGQPTVLFYGHYDVQPPDPLGEWITPPFEPTVRDGNLYARGAADDKGQVYAQVQAMDAWMQSEHKLPVNVKFLIEGEEEVGGEAVDAYVRQNRKALACDCVVVSDTAMFAPGLPSLDVGLRGMVYTEVEVQGPGRDLHSGLYGGVAPNPFEALARMITGLKSPEGKILIPGFYDRVQPPSPEEMAAWKRLPFDEKEYQEKEVRASALVGEAGFSVQERTWSRPTFDVHGMPGGFTGPGSKTVIPARASAKMSMRLVPNQKPQEIFALFKAAVERLTPPGFHATVNLLNAADPVLVDPRNRFVRAGVTALQRTFGAEPVFIRSGGSVPIVALFDSELKVPTVMMGFGLPDDGLHSPNEKFALSCFQGGIRAVAEFLAILANGANG